MTSHEFAFHLLSGPDLPIFVPRVKEYLDTCDDDCCADPDVSTHEGTDPDDHPCEVLVISYRK